MEKAQLMRAATMAPESDVQDLRLVEPCRSDVPGQYRLANLTGDWAGEVIREQERSDGSVLVRLYPAAWSSRPGDLLRGRPRSRTAPH